MALPICKLCYNKGFSSQLMGDTQKPNILFCKCMRGQNLKKLIDLNYVEREKVTVGINKFMHGEFGPTQWKVYAEKLKKTIELVEI